VALGTAFGYAVTKIFGAAVALNSLLGAILFGPSPAMVKKWLGIEYPLIVNPGRGSTDVPIWKFALRKLSGLAHARRPERSVACDERKPPGCWYTKVVTATDNGAPSGVYQERGAEIFVGTLDGGAVGTFTTTYKFTSKWDPDISTGAEVRGRCQHPIVAASGTGGFAGASGRVDFKDEVTTGEFLFRGHISLG